MNAPAVNIQTNAPPALSKPDPGRPALVAIGGSVTIGTGVTFNGRAFPTGYDVPAPEGGYAIGYDYEVVVRADEEPFAQINVTGAPVSANVLGGFHYAPAGNAERREGSETGPAINEFSIWDLNFRPACPDPRGMALVDGRFWVDIYLLGTDHVALGTSRYGEPIADGREPPRKPDGSLDKKLDFATAKEIYAHHGKQLLGAEEFFIAAYGVKERCSLEDEPETTGDLDGEAKRFVSKWGLFGVTGTMWQWGTDGDPDDPRASLFGGSWVAGGSAGSRYANLDNWAGYSGDDLSARGRSDHLIPV